MEEQEQKIQMLEERAGVWDIYIKLQQNPLYITEDKELLQHGKNLAEAYIRLCPLLAIIRQCFNGKSAINDIYSFENHIKNCINLIRSRNSTISLLASLILKSMIKVYKYIYIYM